MTNAHFIIVSTAFLIVLYFALQSLVQHLCRHSTRWAGRGLAEQDEKEYQSKKENWKEDGIQ